MTKQSRVPIVTRMIALGLADDEQMAREMIFRRRVLVQGSIVENDGRLVAAGDPIIVKHDDEFVSRGGTKLQHALKTFNISVGGKTVLDVGASTGGFTDCALQAGADRVYSLDVGKTQLHERIKNDPRVVVVDDFNARDLSDDARRSARGVPSEFDLVIVDVSFISVTRIVRSLTAVAKSGADLVVLIKPQFECTRDEANRGSGVIVSRDIHERVVGEVVASFVGAGCEGLGVIESPITGASGNVEFLAHFRMSA